MTMRGQLPLAIAIADLAAQAPSPAAAAAAAAPVRLCAWCDRKLGKHKRVDAITCSKKCRQAKSRHEQATARAELALAAARELPEVSRKTIASRRLDGRVLTRAALSRTGLVLDEPLAAKQVRSATRPSSATRGKESPID